MEDIGMSGKGLFRKRYLIALSFLLIVAIIFFGDPASVLGNAARMRPQVLPELAVLIAFSLIIRAFKWKLVLNETKNISLWGLLPVSLAGALIRDTIPAKAGEPSKAFLLSQAYGIKASKGIVSVLWDRIMDFAAVASFGLIFLALYFDGLNQTEHISGLIAILAVFLCCLIGILALTQRRIGERVFTLVLRLPFARKLLKESTLDSFYGTSVGAFNIFFNYVLTMTSVFVEGLMFFVVFRSMGVYVNPFFIVSAFSFSVLCGFISFLPAGIGSLEAVFVICLLTQGLSKGETVAAVIATRSLGFLTLYLLGIVSYALLLKRKGST